MRNFLCVFTILISFAGYCQTDYSTSIREWQINLNEEIKDREESPLPKNEIRKFKGLDFFPINEKYRIEADFKRTLDAKPFTMPTTTSRKPVYVMYGIASFTLNGKSIELPIYQSLRLSKMEGYEDYLFAPFTDLTNGETSYGGGRYLDLKINDKTDKITIDFNKSYNPYCAYSDRFSCLIPPRENDIPLKIEAGVKA